MLVNVVAVMVNGKERRVQVTVVEGWILYRVTLDKDREACGDDDGEGEESRGGL